MKSDALHLRESEIWYSYIYGQVKYDTFAFLGEVKYDTFTFLGEVKYDTHPLQHVYQVHTLS